MNKNWLLLLLVVVITILPFTFIKDSEFGGADGAADEVVSSIAPDYEPWAEPLWAPPGGETESLLFALQAALGAGVIGYAIGFWRGRQQKSDEHVKSTHVTDR